MKLLFKFIFKYDFSKKNIFRTLILLFSITISTTLFVGTLLASNLLIETYDEYMKKQFKDYNVIVEPRDGVKSDFTSFDERINIIENISEAHFLSSDDTRINVFGIEKLQSNHNADFRVVKKNEVEHKNGKIYGYISINTSERFNIAIGDTINTISNGNVINITVDGIVSNEFVFSGDNSKQFSIVIDRESLKLNVSDDQLFNYYYLNVNADDIDKWVSDFISSNENYKARKCFEETEVKQSISLISTPLYFMLIVVLICSVFVMINSYKLVILDRLPVLGTFLSLGSTYKIMIISLLWECVGFGVCAGVIGGLSGNLLGKIIVEFSNPLKEYNFSPGFTFQGKYVILAIIFSVIFSIVSALLPIASLKKYSLKDILTEDIEAAEKQHNNHFSIGISLVLLSIICKLFYMKIGFLIMIALLFLFVGTIICVPMICKVMTYLIGITHKKNEGIGLLIKNDFSGSKITLSSIKVLTATLIVIIMLNSIGNKMSSIVKDGYRVINFNIFLDVKDERLQDVRDVVTNDDFLIHETGNIKAFLDDDKKKMVSLIYVDTEKYKVFENYIRFKDKNSELEKLGSVKNGIILSKQIAKMYNIESGDKITLSTADGDVAELEVISICDPIMWKGGNYNIISQNAAKDLFKIKYPSNYYISFHMNDEEAVEYYTDKLRGYDVDIYPKDELVKYEEQNLKSIASMMKMLSNTILICGLLSIGGNALISAVYKRKEILGLKILGLENGHSVLMIVLENIYRVLISFGIATIASKLMIIYMSDFMSFLNFEMNLSFPVEQFGVVFLCILTGYILIGLLSCSKSKGLSISEIQKY